MLASQIIRAGKIAYDLCHPPINGSSLNLPDNCCANKMTFQTEDHKTLSALDVMPLGEVKGTILLCHYLGGCKEMMIHLMEPLLQQGYRLIAFDFRNHGESQGDKNIYFSLIKDFEGIMSYLRCQNLKGNFGVIGFSMGATAAVHGVSRYPEITAAIIDSGPLLSVKEYFQYILKIKKVSHPIERAFFVWFYLYFAKFLQMKKTTHKNLISISQQHQTKKIFFIHGQRDTIIPLADAKNAYDLSSPASEIWTVPKARHLTSRMLCEEEYLKKIMDFFNKNLLTTGEKGFESRETKSNKGRLDITQGK